MDFLAPILLTLIGSAGVTSFVMQLLKTKLLPAIDKLPALGKQFILLLIAAALPILAQMIGVPLPESLDGFTTETVTAVLTALTAMGIHAVKKALAPKVAEDAPAEEAPTEEVPAEDPPAA